MSWFRHLTVDEGVVLPKVGSPLVASSSLSYTGGSDQLVVGMLDLGPGDTSEDLSQW